MTDGLLIHLQPPAFILKRKRVPVPITKAES